MSNEQHTHDPNRREFFERVSLGMAAGLGVGLAGCSKKSTSDSSLKPLKAAFSNAGLQSTWCSLGKDTAELWGKLLNVDVEWFDGEMDPGKQRDKIDGMVSKDWDFCCFQAVQTDSLAAPVKKLKERGIPVISMDTLLVPMDKMRETGVWIEVTPDHVEMARQSTGYMMEKIGGKGKVIHIGGLSSHSGAQGRKQGFEETVAEYSDVEVVGNSVRWADWSKDKARNIFETLLEQEKDEPIAGAFFHSDDMAIAAMVALKQEQYSLHKDMVVTAVDGQKEGLTAVKEGTLAATTVNPVCRIHAHSLIIGQFIARNEEKIDDVPLEIITPGPLVSPELPNVMEAMLYLSDPAHCMV